jgi:tetratricopeptide (TPR) repeat protein
MTPSGAAAIPRSGAAVAIVAFLVFANALAGGFVWDDLFQVVRNPWIRDWHLLGQAFTHHLAGFLPGYETSYYRPLVHVLHAAIYAAFGLAPWAYHLAGVVLHACASVGLYVLLRRWSPGGWPPVLAALLFAVHPIHVEPVAWVTGVFDVACGLFVILALLAATSERPSRWFLAAPLFGIALLWKEPAMAFLPVAAALLLARGDLVRRRRPALGFLAALAAVAAAYLAMRVNALGSLAGAARNSIRVGPVETLLTDVALVEEYAGKLLVPVGLSPVHDLALVVSPWDVRFAIGSLLVLGLAWAAWAARRSPELLLGLALLVFPLLPALYLPALKDSLFAERYLYLPSAGAAILVGAALRRWQGALPRAAVVAAIAVLAVATVVRSRAWHDELTLWADAASKAPRSALAHESLGYALVAAGRSREAIPVLARALELDPGRLDARTNLAVALASTGRIGEALAQAERVLREHPREVNALLVRAGAMADAGRLEEAMAAYEAALAVEPDRAAVHNQAGIVSARLGRREQAVHHFGAAARLDPGNVEYARNLASASR